MTCLGNTLALIERLSCRRGNFLRNVESTKRFTRAFDVLLSDVHHGTMLYSLAVPILKQFLGRSFSINKKTKQKQNKTKARG